jgi:hypothetical protein
MQSRRNGDQIEIVFHRSFRRLVKILPRAKAPLSADREHLHFPVGTSLPAPFRKPTRRVKKPRVMRLDSMVQPDWRIVGDHDPELTRTEEIQ